MGPASQSKAKRFVNDFWVELGIERIAENDAEVPYKVKAYCPANSEYCGNSHTTLT